MSCLSHPPLRFMLRGFLAASPSASPVLGRAPPGTRLCPSSLPLARIAHGRISSPFKGASLPPCPPAAGKTPHTGDGFPAPAPSPRSWSASLRRLTVWLRAQGDPCPSSPPPGGSQAPSPGHTPASAGASPVLAHGPPRDSYKRGAVWVMAGSPWRWRTQAGAPDRWACAHPPGASCRHRQRWGPAPRRGSWGGHPTPRLCLTQRRADRSRCAFRVWPEGRAASDCCLRTYYVRGSGDTVPALEMVTVSGGGGRRGSCNFDLYRGEAGRGLKATQTSPLTVRRPEV